MAQITLYCEEARGLRLGPGVGNIQAPGQVIVFQDGFASFDDKDFPDYQAWFRGAPHIEILEAAAGQVVTGGSEFVCERHDPPKAFKNQKALNGHLLSHRKAAAAE